MNDGFGALAGYLHAHAPVCVTDSPHQRAGHPGQSGGKRAGSPRHHPAGCPGPCPMPPALVVIKVSKYQALLEQQLLALRGVVTPATRIIAAGKAGTSTPPPSSCSKVSGETRTSLAWKKAPHSLHPGRRAPVPDQSLPRPSGRWKAPTCSSTTMPTCSRARAWISAPASCWTTCPSTVPAGDRSGMWQWRARALLLARDSEVEVTFIDESRMAVASARLNVEHNLPDACPVPTSWSTTVSMTFPSGQRTGSSAIPLPSVAGDHRSHRLADVQRCPPGVASGANSG